MSLESNQNNLNHSEIDPFLMQALKTPKDCLSILEIERDLEEFMNDFNLKQMEFPSMNGYLRMLVHKISHCFNLSHTYLPEKRAVLIKKQENSQIPTFKFKDLAKEDDEEEDVKPPIRLLSRSNNSNKTNVPEKPIRILKKSKGNNGTDINFESTNTTKLESKEIDEKLIQEKLEEREKEYEKARARIFNDNNISKQDDELEIKNDYIQDYNQYSENQFSYVHDTQEDYWSYPVSSNPPYVYPQIPISYYQIPYFTYNNFYISNQNNYVNENWQTDENGKHIICDLNILNY